ncbi:hypothetical protein [uncultured Streptomyces sp.]|uniref:hypothetical protein n=1 Tax=uncultured Streptomyces sp. TaxID=174707 RepID=UPI0026059054|nr:hypothetical protein [uncultured Streptomyces sp.]
MRRADGSPGPSRRIALGAVLAAAAVAGTPTPLAGGPEREEPRPDGKAAPPRRHASRLLAAHGRPPFYAAFPLDGLVTNEYAFRHPDTPDARLHEDWTVTSGSLFAHRGAGWSGIPDGLSPDPASRLATGSAVLRVVTSRTDFVDVTAGGLFALRPPGSTPRTPATEWDGGHLWLRYRSPQELYSFSFSRRDGTVAIKRKAPPAGTDEGVYTTLAQTVLPFRYGAWHHVTARAKNTASRSVRLHLQVAGRLVLEAEDTAPGSLTGPGAAGVRGDNTELFFRTLTVM